MLNVIFPFQYLSLEFSSSPLVKITLVLVSLLQITIYFEFHPTKCFVKGEPPKVARPRIWPTWLVQSFGDTCYFCKSILHIHYSFLHSKSETISVFNQFNSYVELKLNSEEKSLPIDWGRVNAFLKISTNDRIYASKGVVI